MQNIPEDEMDEGTADRPKKMDTKAVSRIMNNRHSNQIIYKMFLQKRYNECLKYISKCEDDEFKIYVKALIAKNEFKLQKALDLFSQCQMLDRNNFDYLKHMAKTFYLVAKFRSSLEAVKDAVKLDPNNSEVHYIMGKISTALRDQEGSIIHLKTSISKEQNEAAYLEQARVYMRQEKIEEASIVIQSALEFANESAELYEMMAEIYHKRGRRDEAINYYQKSLQRDGYRFQSLLALGTLKQAKQEVEQAFKLFMQANKISPNSAALWNNIAINCLKKKKVIGAYSCLKRALYLDPFRWDIHANLGIIFMKNKRFFEAQIHFKTAVKLKRDASLLNLWGICLKNLRDFKNSMMCFQEALKLEPRNQEIKCNYLLACVESGNIQENQSVFREFLDQVSDSKVKHSLSQIKDKFL